MKGFSLDIAELQQNLADSRPKKAAEPIEHPNRIPYVTNKAKFVRKAFDMFESKFDHSIWELAEEDGASFLIKRTDLDTNLHKPVVENESSPVNNRAGAWGVNSGSNGDLSLSLYGIPVRVFSKTQFGFDEATADAFASHLLEQIAGNKNIAQKYVKATGDKSALIAACKENSLDETARDVCLWLSDKPVATR